MTIRGKNGIFYRQVYFGDIWIFCVIAISSFFLIKYDRKKKGKENEEFMLWILRLNQECVEESVEQFLCFIKSYQGGVHKKEKRKIMNQDFTLKEKQELEYLFYQIIAPSNQIKVQTKEDLRNYLCLKRGMTCLLQPPYYEIKEDLEKII